VQRQTFDAGVRGRASGSAHLSLTVPSSKHSISSASFSRIGRAAAYLIVILLAAASKRLRLLVRRGPFLIKTLLFSLLSWCVRRADDTCMLGGAVAWTRTPDFFCC